MPSDVRSGLQVPEAGSVVVGTEKRPNPANQDGGKPPSGITLEAIMAELQEIKRLLAVQDLKTLTVNDAALIAGVKPLTVRHWLDVGLLRGNKSGDTQQARWYIKRQDLYRFFTARVNQASLGRSTS